MNCVYNKQYIFSETSRQQWHKNTYSVPATYSDRQCVYLAIHAPYNTLNSQIKDGEFSEVYVLNRLEKKYCPIETRPVR